VLHLALSCGTIWHHREKPQHRCTTTVHPVYNCSKKRFLQNLLPVGLLVRTNLFIPSRFLDYRCEVWQLLSAPGSDADIWKKIYRCTSTFSALNYCVGIFFISLSYLYEVVRTNFSANFWTFRNFWRQFRWNIDATWRCKWGSCSAPNRASPSEKNGWNGVKIDP